MHYCVLTNLTWHLIVNTAGKMVHKFTTLNFTLLVVITGVESIAVA